MCNRIVFHIESAEQADSFCGPTVLGEERDQRGSGSAPERAIAPDPRMLERMRIFGQDKPTQLSARRQGVAFESIEVVYSTHTIANVNLAKSDRRRKRGTTRLGSMARAGEREGSDDRKREAIGENTLSTSMATGCTAT